MRIFFTCLLTMSFTAFLCLNTAFGQTTNLTESYWNNSNLASIEASVENGIQIHARKADYYQMDFESFYSAVLNAADGTQISLPIGGGFQTFVLTENSTMTDGLRENYPGINSYNIVSTNSRMVWGKMDVSHNGFHAMIFQAGKSTLFIDPVFHNEPAAYMVYRRIDFESDKSFECHLNGHEQEGGDVAKGIPYTDCVMNTYRFAVAATGEYTAFQGGDVEDALAAQVTTMNRVNMVYERDFGVNLSIIENNDEIIYTNGNTDPYTNGDAGDMIVENQNNINSVIGSANYDVGHVFGTNSGGLAGLGVTCSNNSKARGVTGSSSPINDPFDIDYVAHEVGHQFGGRHSFNNSCNGNRSNNTAVEPGSGSTIMAYAGICAPNIQNNSDDYFHGVNMTEIGQQINSDNCQVVTDLGNNGPVLGLLPEEVLIPVSTPFILKASASDVDGDTLTYCWEQMDNEISNQPPEAAATGGPSFRSFDPVVDSLRYLPSLTALANGGPYTWERLSNGPRNMNFRVSVRDNAFMGGCTQYDELNVVAIATAGPFTVIYPSDISIVWQAFEYETILWDVANTTAAPLNAETVDIFLSLDDGETYDIQLADDIENDGSHTIQVPNLPTYEAMIMVVNSEGTFFDVSNNDFTIEGIDEGFWFETAEIEEAACQSETVTYEIDINQVGEFSETVSLSITDQPENANVVLSQTEVNVGESITVTVSDMENTPAGMYVVEITGAGSDFQNQIALELSVYADSPSSTTLLLPENESNGVETFATLTWEDNATVGEFYMVEISDDESFTNVIDQASELELATYQVMNLGSETTYYWRVYKQNECGISESSEVFEFTTFACEALESNMSVQEIPSEGTSQFTTDIEVLESGIIADVNVMDLTGNHSRMSDLKISLESPSGTIIDLLSGACGANATLLPSGLQVYSPEGIEGAYTTTAASDFGGDIPAAGISGSLVLAIDDNADPNLLCDDAINPEEVAGNIAVVMRGNCQFTAKVENAQDAGAAAVIVINNDPGGGIFNMGGTSNSIDIPSVMISYEDGQTLISGIGLEGLGFILSLDDEASEMVSCPATNGGLYQPSEALSAFNGEDAQGTWTLKVEDVVDGEGGTFDSWALQICFSDLNPDGIGEKGGVEANIYPNPTTEVINVDLAFETSGEVTLHDISGRVISQQAIQNQRLQFNLSTLSGGIYFIKIDSPKYGQSVYKVIKQ